MYNVAKKNTHLSLCSGSSSNFAFHGWHCIQQTFSTRYYTRSCHVLVKDGCCGQNLKTYVINAIQRGKSVLSKILLQAPNSLQFYAEFPVPITKHKIVILLHTVLFITIISVGFTGTLLKNNTFHALKSLQTNVFTIYHWMMLPKDT